MNKTAMRAAAALHAVLMLLGLSGLGVLAADASGKIDPQLAGMLETAEDGDVFHIDVWLDYEFDESTLRQPDGRDGAQWKDYRARLTQAAEEYYTRVVGEYAENLKGLADDAEIMTLCPVIECSATKANMGRIAGLDRVVSIMCADLAPVPAIDSMAETQPDASLAGDVNEDGFVRTGDARAILRHAASVEKLCTLRELAIADVTGDGFVRTDDARRALRISAGIETGGTVLCPEKKDLSALRTGTVAGNNLYDLSEPRELVAGMSYVFAAKVLRAVDYQTEFNKDATPAELGDIRNEAMTYLEIEVVENLKGNLLKNTKIPFFKGGGVTADGRYIELFEHDLIPEEGRYYVFVAYARQDGSLIGGCEYGCVPLEEKINNENLDESEVIRRFRAACASPAPIFADSQYLHYLARWDADFVSEADNLERSMEIREPDKAAIAAYQAEKRAKYEQPSGGGTEPPPPTEPFGA